MNRGTPSGVAVLPPAPWREAAATGRVIAALEAAGGAPRFVGGCVRDALLGRPVADVDIATPLKPDAVPAADRKSVVKGQRVSVRVALGGPRIIQEKTDTYTAKCNTSSCTKTQHTT